MTTDPAGLLSAAATRLREVAGAAPWRFRYLGSTGDGLADQVTYMDDDCERSITVSAPGEAARIMALIAVMSPPVALALADLFDTVPDTGTSSITYHAALAVARAILRNQP